MPPFDRIRAIQRFVRQEGIASAMLRAAIRVSGLVYRLETAYILVRPVDRALDAPVCLNGITIELLREDQINQLAAVAYCARKEIVRRLNDGQQCIIAKHQGDIVHYSWLTPRSEYAAEVEMMIPVETGETYLYNCRTLASARGLGIFPAVITRALEEAGKSGASHMIALVSRNNKPSLRAFSKMRFSIRQETTLTRFLLFRKHLTEKHGKS